MPPGKVLQPVLKMKVDELFLCWLSEASTQRMLQDGLHRIKAPGPAALGAGDAGPPGAWPPACRPGAPEPPGAAAATPGPAPALPLGAAASPRPGPHARGARRSAGPRAVQARKAEPLPPATSHSIPAFYFPRGRPKDTVDVDAGGQGLRLPTVLEGASLLWSRRGAHRLSVRPQVRGHVEKDPPKLPR
ncbi:Hypothetical predicted protein [Marmota monax]|uniref:Uncharacterized protein n=1 Tax=Marmota monax TaxID=9995 RepID=A0A5E4C8Q5_MARMO|nr:Hypothetical predicted protein [Marmota monax]